MKTLAIIVLVASVIVGSAFGLLVNSVSPPGQVFAIKVVTVHTYPALSCQTIPGEYANWMVIEVLQNRTGINFVSVTALYQNFRTDSPLNGTAYAYYHSVNSTYETITVPMAGYFAVGENIVIAISYYIVGYSPTIYNAGSVQLLPGNMTC